MCPLGNPQDCWSPVYTNIMLTTKPSRCLQTLHGIGLLTGHNVKMNDLYEDNETRQVDTIHEIYPTTPSFHILYLSRQLFLKHFAEGWSCMLSRHVFWVQLCFPSTFLEVFWKEVIVSFLVHPFFITDLELCDVSVLCCSSVL